MANDSVYTRIYNTVRRIPAGRVATYGQIAGLVRDCSGPRQVGYALHALPRGSAVPWHRVVNARGAVSLSGSDGITQQLLLECEGLRVQREGRVDLKKYRWQPRSSRAAR
jgi:methylated-DNA-protein-cysteine methyltransferase-like protein